MAKRDEFSSTEKLLELIRTNSSGDIDTAEANTPPASFIGRFTAVLRNALTLKKSVTIGVDIGYNDLKLVKIQTTSSQNIELTDYARIPFEPDINPEHPDFVKFLKTSLSRFCGSLKYPNIWANISSAKVDLRYLKIPKVPQKQIANAVYWSHKRIAPFNEEDVILDFEVIEETVEGGTPKITAISYTTPKQDVRTFKSLFSRSGYPLRGISTVPFSFQNLLRSGWVRQEQNTVSNLYIGRGWSRIDIFSGGNLVLSRGIKAGIKTMNEAISGETIEAEEKSGIELPLEFFQTSDIPSTEATPEPPELDSQKAQQIFFDLIHDTSTENDTQTTLPSEKEKVLKLIMPALRRLVQQVERTFEHYTTHLNNEPVEKIYISSSIRPHRRIVNYIGDELGILRDTFDPFVTDARYLGDIAPPDTKAEREAYTPALGMALSMNAITPNLLYTHEAKSKAAKSRLVNKVSMVVFVILLVASFGFNYRQGQVIDGKKTDIRRLDNQLKSYKTPVDQNLILKLVGQSQTKRNELKKFGKQYTSVAVLSEISNLTPSNVRLITISTRLSEKPGKKASKLPKELTLEGIILGDRSTMEAVLATYLLRLSDSPIFERPIIKKKEPGYFYDKEVLRFTAQLNLV